MKKLENGVWFSKTAVDLKRFTARSGNKIYNILAENYSQAEEKARDQFQNFVLEEIK